MDFTRIAVFSDIHANREAFAAVIEDAALQGADGFVLLGDIVGYGPDPAWCLDRAIQLADGGAICVLGNHDHAINHSDARNPSAQALIHWTRGQLSAEQRGFLAGLPLTRRLDDMLFVHASAQAPQEWVHVDGPGPALACLGASDAPVIVCGHMHRPALYSNDQRGGVQTHPVPLTTPMPLLLSRRWIGVCGSVGQPRDGIAQAAYVMIDKPNRQIAWRRVPYDAAATARKLRAADLPASLADRLRSGR
ncbi:MAG TPA: metallophosphoesterase family protein [Paenirhodobacter sp.]